MNPKRASSKRMKDLEIISDIEVLKHLFSRQIRAKIVFEYLVNEAMTVKQLADELGKNPGNILRHIDKLKEAGIVHQVKTEKTNTGIVQRYYRATAREYRPDSPYRGGNAAALSASAAPGPTIRSWQGARVPVCARPIRYTAREIDDKDTEQCDLHAETRLRPCCQRQTSGARYEIYRAFPATQGPDEAADLSAARGAGFWSAEALRSLV